MSGRPDPKPKARPRKQIRLVEKGATRRAVLNSPWCPLCGARSATGHHVVPKGSPHFGDDVPENIVALCGDGTRGCHGAVEERRVWARAALGAYLLESRPDVLRYVRGKLGASAGEEWLRRHLHVEVGLPS